MNKIALLAHQQLTTSALAHELLSFSVNQELFAVELRDIMEIVVPPPITIVPRASPKVLGVCSVRGQLVTVLDLRRILGLPPAAVTTQPRILLAQCEGDILGLQVDQIRQVVRLQPHELELTNNQGSTDTIEAVRGIGRPADSDILVIFDLQTLFMRGRS